MTGTNGHAPASRCPAVAERADVTRRLAGAFAIPLDVAGMDLGSEKALAVVFSVVRGIVNEYLDGGDQLAEACTCGHHVGPPCSS